MARMNSGYANERELARAIAKAKAKSKTLLPAPFKNEKEMADAMADAIAKQVGFTSPKTKVSPTPKPKPTKKASPSPKPKTTLGPLPKNPTLNDYLIRGLKPPVKGNKRLPSDADVKLKGYNS